jgi:hypothetical protein
MPDEPRAWPRPFFFVHVMKTAGMTLNRHMNTNFAPDQRYPTDGDRAMDYMMINRLHDAIAERGERVRVWRGHFPFYVTALVPDAITMTILREPVARTLSMLAQYRARNEPDKTLEAVYDDPKVCDRMLRNHQTRVFSFTEADEPPTYLKVIDLDAARLAAAKATLERVDLLGVQEEFPKFLDALEHRFDWQIDAIEDIHVGPETTVPESLRRRIREDTLLDAELYEHARGLVGR